MTIRTVLAALLVASIATASSSAASQDPPVQSADKIYVLTYTQGPAWISGRPMQEQELAEHAKYMRSLLENRVLIAAGPFLQANGGMAIVRAPDQTSANSMVESDPAVINGTFKGSVSEWLPVFGTIEAAKN